MSMKIFSDLITSEIPKETPSLIVIIVIVVIGIIFRANIIYKFYNEIKKNKLNFLIDISKKDFLDKTTAESVYEKINNDIFKITTGIQTNQYIRKKIMELYKEKKGEITLYDIKNAISFLKIKNENILIELTKFDYYSYIFSGLYSLFTILLAFMLIVFPLFILGSDSVSIKEYITMMIMGIGLIFITIPILKDTFAYKAAKKIKKIIEES